jgi:type VI secretion system secreted protein Hcp
MAFNAYLKIDGILGESRDRNHKGEIDVLAFSWGISQTGSQTGGGGGAGKTQISDFQIVKSLDVASPQLFAAVCSGEHFDEAVFTIETETTRTGRSQGYYKVTLSEVLISSVVPSGGNGEPTEQVSLNFQKAEIEFQDQRGHSQAATCDAGKQVIP